MKKGAADKTTYVCSFNKVLKPGRLNVRKIHRYMCTVMYTWLPSHITGVINIQFRGVVPVQEGRGQDGGVCGCMCVNGLLILVPGLNMLILLLTSLT